MTRSRSQNSIRGAPQRASRKPSGPSTTRSALALKLGRALVGGDADADGALEPPAVAAARAAPRTRRGRCGRRRRRARRHAARPRPGAARRSPLSTSPAAAARAPCGPSAGRGPRSAASAATSRARCSAAAASAAPRQWIAWIGPLSSSRRPTLASAVPVEPRRRTRPRRRRGRRAPDRAAARPRPGASSSSPWLPA